MYGLILVRQMHRGPPTQILEDNNSHAPYLVTPPPGDQYLLQCESGSVSSLFAPGEAVIVQFRVQRQAVWRQWWRICDKKI